MHMPRICWQVQCKNSGHTLTASGLWSSKCTACKEQFEQHRIYWRQQGSGTRALVVSSVQILLVYSLGADHQIWRQRTVLKIEKISSSSPASTGWPHARWTASRIRIPAKSTRTCSLARWLRSRSPRRNAACRLGSRRAPASGLAAPPQRYPRFSIAPLPSAPLLPGPPIKVFLLLI